MTADEFVFQSPTGKVLHHKTFYRRLFKPAVVAAGLPRPCGFTTSATPAPRSASPWAPIQKRSQERLGHSSITVTLDRYGHLFPKLDEALTQRLDTLRQEAVDTLAAAPPAAAVGQLRALPLRGGDVGG
ncbi:MAG: hypothetical protein M3P34_05930 [Actinomycetota bacterium]|nr:hypothetical protein [Actinomycetota bacterium]